MKMKVDGRVMIAASSKRERDGDEEDGDENGEAGVSGGWVSGKPKKREKANEN